MIKGSMVLFVTRFLFLRDIKNKETQLDQASFSSLVFPSQREGQLKDEDIESELRKGKEHIIYN
jgi:hypothetical protein